MICYWGMVVKYDTSNRKDFFKASVNSLKNQLFCTLPSSFLFFNYYTVNYENSIASALIFPLFIVLGDIYFFLTHYPLHNTFLWKYHKTHHNGNVHVAKSLDADLIEHFIGNLGSFIFPFLVIRYFNFVINVYVFYLWVAFATISTCISHLGFKDLGDNGIHHLHHKYLKCNFGTGFYIMDRIVGTYRNGN